VVRSVGACDPDDVINELLEKLAVDALSSNFLNKRTVKSYEPALPLSYQRPSSSSSSGPAYRREAHATDCRAPLESDGFALPVSYQQPGSTSLLKPKHFPEAYANGGAGREAAHKWQALATGCCAAPSSRSVGVSDTVESIDAFSGKLFASMHSSSLVKKTVQSSGSALPVSYQRPGSISLSGPVLSPEVYAAGGANK
jgi:hypothetical protein